MTKIKIGSHLISPRAGYSHHGIYAGNAQVIHYSGLADGLSAGPIEVTSLKSFRNGAVLSVREYRDPKYSGQQVVDRARERIGEDDYDLQGNNCEHFCTWAVTGRSNSRQVDFIEDCVDVVLPSLALLAKARKYSKQRNSGADVFTDVTMEVAEIGVKVAIAVAAPVSLPAVVAYKAVKWIIK